MPTLRITVAANRAREKMTEVEAWMRGPMDGMLVAGTAAETCVKRHVMRLARERHGSAERLGARPSGHWDASLVSLDGTGPSEARVRVAIQGAARAFGPVEIRPVQAGALAIPLHALAYGIRPAELARRMETFTIRRKDRPQGAEDAVVFGRLVRSSGRGRKRKTTEEIIPLYKLKARVRQRQDPTLMPDDETLGNAAARALRVRAKLLFGGPSA